MKRIAFFVPSGVAPATSVMHIPVLSKLVHLLSNDCMLTVYSLSTKQESCKDFFLGDAVVKYLPANWNSSFFSRLSAFLNSFRSDHAKNPFDVVHGMWALPAGLAAVIAGKLTGIPSVVSFLGGETAAIHQIGYGYLLSFRKRMILRWITRNAACIHLLTRFQQHQLQRQRMTTNSVTRFPFGVDAGEFSPNGEVSLKPPYHFLHVANLTEVKDQPTLLRAFKKVTEHVPAVLRIVGPDHLDGTIQKLAAQLQVAEHVEFIGFVPHHELCKYYRWAHILLQTSLHEAQSLSVVEAMSSGTVVAGTRVGLLADLPDDYVVTVQAADAEGLAKRVLSLLEAPVTFESLRTRSRSWAEEHSIGWTVQQCRSVYESLCSDNVS